MFGNIGRKRIKQRTLDQRFAAQRIDSGIERLENGFWGGRMRGLVKPVAVCQRGQARPHAQYFVRIQFAACPLNQGLHPQLVAHFGVIDQRQLLRVRFDVEAVHRLARQALIEQRDKRVAKPRLDIDPVQFDDGNRIEKNPLLIAIRTPRGKFGKLFAHTTERSGDHLAHPGHDARAALFKQLGATCRADGQFIDWVGRWRFGRRATMILIWQHDGGVFFRSGSPRNGR